MFVIFVCFLVLHSSPHFTAADDWYIPNCTASCECSNNYASDNSTDDSRLTILCRTSVGTDTTSVTEEVTRYLELLPRNVSSTLRSLKITAHLGTIPEPICRMSSLFFLYLSNSHIVRFQDNCLNRLSNLVTFESSWGELIELQDGLFDGLGYLKKLTFRQNKITQIGTHLFANESRLNSLTNIGLDNNNLTSLDAWIFHRVRIGLSSDKFVTISFTDNHIKRFTNNIAWQFNCTDLQRYYAQIVLTGNNVRRVDDIIRGWGLDWTECNIAFISIILSSPFDTKTLSCDCNDYNFRKAFPKKLNVWLFRYLRYDCSFKDMVCDSTDDCPTGCICIYSIHDKAVKVDCTSAGLTALPSKLPTLKPDCLYVIDFSNNPHLTKLVNSEYLVKTSSFNVSNSGIDAIEDIAARQLFQVVNTVDLSGNRLKSLPKAASSVRPTANNTRINLLNNPWDCSCSNGWMISWLESMKDNLVDDEHILCDSPAGFNNKQLLRMTIDDLCDNPVSRAMVVAIAVSLSVFAVVVVSLLVVWRIRIRLFVTLHIHPFDRDECEGEDMEYDVFFSCCDDDEDESGNFILKRIEKEGYKVCYRARDFHGGRTNFENMTVAIQHSKRTVCLITENFLRDTYCVYEFEQAFDHYLLNLGRRRLIALVQLDDPTSTVDTLESKTMREFIRRYTFIKYNQQSDDSVWLNRLLYALPVKGMLQQQRNGNLGNDVDADQTNPSSSIELINCS